MHGSYSNLPHPYRAGVGNRRTVVRIRTQAPTYTDPDL